MSFFCVLHTLSPNNVPWFLLLTLCLISIHAKKHILGSNEILRHSKCEEEACDYLCLATKCGNEYITPDPTEYAKNTDWVGIINVYCTEEFSCLGRITIEGIVSMGMLSQKKRIEQSKLYCNNAVKHSCQGAELSFTDTLHQYLIGDVRESDILFKNAESATIVIEDESRDITEKFFLNEVFTQDVTEMNIIALAPYSAVGSVFDLTGVNQRISIQCKGKNSCSGSLFIFNYCYIRPFERIQILCGINACNGISIWILNENDQCPYKEQTDKAHPVFGCLINIIPFVSGDKLKSDEEASKLATEWSAQKLKDVFVMIEDAPRPQGRKASAKELIVITKSWSVLGKKPSEEGYHIFEEAFWKRFCKENERKHQKMSNAGIMIDEAGDSCKYSGNAFRVHWSENKEEWYKELQKHLQNLENLKQASNKYISNVHIRNPSMTEYYGGVMMEGMFKKLGAAVFSGSTAVGLVVLGLKHAAFFATLGHAALPLVIPGIILVGAGFLMYKHGKKRKHRFDLPDSKFEVDDDDNIVTDAGKQSMYNVFDNEEMYDSNWIELDENGNMIQYDLLTGDRYYAMEEGVTEGENVVPLESMHHMKDNYNNYDSNGYMVFSAVIVFCCFCLCMILIFCFGGVVGFLSGNRYKRYEDNRKHTEQYNKV